MRSRQIDRASALQYLPEILALNVHVIRLAALLPDALRISLDSDISVYDACYLSLAKIMHAWLITADRRLIDKVRGRAGGPDVVYIGDLDGLPRG